MKLVIWQKKNHILSVLTFAKKIEIVLVGQTAFPHVSLNVFDPNFLRFLLQNSRIPKNIEKMNFYTLEWSRVFKQFV